MRASRTNRSKESPVTYTAMRPDPLSLDDNLIRRWCQEEAECCPPRLSAKDLENPERFRTRLADWIRRQC